MSSISFLLKIHCTLLCDLVCHPYSYASLEAMLYPVLDHWRVYLNIKINGMIPFINLWLLTHKTLHWFLLPFYVININGKYYLKDLLRHCFSMIKENACVCQHYQKCDLCQCGKRSTVKFSVVQSCSSLILSAVNPTTHL